MVRVSNKLLTSVLTKPEGIKIFGSESFSFTEKDVVLERSSEATSKGPHEMRLLLFVNETSLARRAAAAGVDFGIVDWEFRGKQGRQASGQFEINRDSPSTALSIASTGLPLCVRINALSDDSLSEIEIALECGARMLMLPMSRSSAQVEEFVQLVAGRAETLVQIETADLLQETDKLARVGWDHAHVGLNDLMLSKGCRNIWESLLDGTAAEICAALTGRSFGFGGLTVVDGGKPIPANLIMSEMVRLNCSLGILRRSFKAEIGTRSVAEEIRVLRDFLTQTEECSPAELCERKYRLYDAIREQL